MGSRPPRFSWPEVVRGFRKDKIPAFLPSEREYELSVATANLLYRFTRPDCVVQPETAGEVEAVVRKARELNVKLTIKSGGHSYAGFSTTKEGILLDLKRMNDVTLEFDNNNEPVAARIQTGARWGDVYRTLINGNYDGYVINGGRCPSVGVGGFILGGGLGPFTRSIGMGSDTLLEATIITAKGDEKESTDLSIESNGKGDEVKRVRVTSRDDPKSDKGRLFWALQGAGGGSFGVVVEIRMAVKKLRNTDVMAGRYTWYPLQSEDLNVTDEPRPSVLMDKRIVLLNTMNAFYRADWSPEMTIDSNWIRDVKDGKNTLGIRFTLYYDGDKDSCHKEIDKHISDTTLATELKKRCMSEPSTRFLYESLVLMWEEEARNSLPRPGDNSYQLYNSFVFPNDLNTISGVNMAVMNAQDDFAREFKTETSTLSVTYIHTGGKASEPSDDHTAYRWRAAVYHTYVTFLWKDKWVESQARAFLARLKVKLKEFSLEQKAAYVNFADATLQDNTHEDAYYGDNHTELRKIKQIWDKDNFFNAAQGIGLPKDETIVEAPKVFFESRMVSNTASLATGDESSSQEPPSGEPLPDSWVKQDIIDRENAALVQFEESLTDSIAQESWKSFYPPPTDYVTLY